MNWTKVRFLNDDGSFIAEVDYPIRSDLLGNLLDFNDEEFERQEEELTSSPPILLYKLKPQG